MISSELNTAIETFAVNDDGDLDAAILIKDTCFDFCEWLQEHGWQIKEAGDER